MNNIKSKRLDLRYFLSKLILVVAGLLLILACINAKLIYNTATFFYSMENLHPPKNLGSDIQATDTYLSDLKEIARLILSSPAEDRRKIVHSYNTFMHINTRTSGKYGYRILNLYLLQHLIFDLPQEYPRDKAYSFVAVIWDGRNTYATGNVTNMLWPYEYDGDHLTIKATLVGIYSDYNGAKEYDYLSSRFNFRTLNALK